MLATYNAAMKSQGIKRRSILLNVFLLGILASCSDPEPTPTPLPTPIPIPTPTPKPPNIIFLERLTTEVELRQSARERFDNDLQDLIDKIDPSKAFNGIPPSTDSIWAELDAAGNTLYVRAGLLRDLLRTVSPPEKCRQIHIVMTERAENDQELVLAARTMASEGPLASNATIAELNSAIQRSNDVATDYNIGLAQCR